MAVIAFRLGPMVQTSRTVAAAGGAGVGGAVGGAGAGPVQAAATSSTETVRPRALRRTGAGDGA
jgi:hypothetical protein